MRRTHFNASGLANFFWLPYPSGALRPSHAPFTMPAMNVGEAIKTLRKLRGLNQAALAAKLAEKTGTDYAQSNISRIENGIQLLDTDQLQTVAEILNVRASDIFALSEVGKGDPRVSKYLQAYSRLSAKQIELILSLADDE